MEKKLSKELKCIQFKNAIYQGEMRNKQLNGLGVMFYFCGHVYFGTFRDNDLHGKGILYYLNGMKMHCEFSHGKLHGHSIINLNQGIFFFMEFLQGNLRGRIVKYNLKRQQKQIFNLNFEMIESLTQKDPTKLIKEVNSFLRKLKIRNSKMKQSEQLRVEIGHFASKNGESYSGIVVNKRPHGLGILAEDANVTKIGFFDKGQASGLCQVRIKDSMSYYGRMQSGKFRGNVLLYIFALNVFSEMFYSENGKSFEFSKGMGIPFKKVFSLFKENLAFYKCSFVSVDDFYFTNILETDNRGSLMRAAVDASELVF